MSVQPGQEVQDKGQQLQVSPERKPTPAEAELAAREAAAKPPAQAEETTPPPAKEEAPDPRFEPYTKELTETGKLSPEAITKAAKEFGVSEKVVQAYVDAQAANLQTNTDNKPLHDAQVGAVQAQAGGADQWNAYREWAATNDPASLKLIGDAVGGNSPEVSKIVVKAALDKAKAQGFGAPRDATNDSQGAPLSGVTGYASAAEQNAAIRDKRYKTDKGYRQSVEAKIAVTHFS